MKPATLLTLALAVCAGCSSARVPAIFDDEDLVADVERAHGLRAWRANKAFQTDIVVTFGDRRMVDGTLTFTTDGRYARIDARDGRTLVFDGQHAWSAPAEKGAEGVRFSLLTWPYFLAVPFKLRDAGAHAVELGDTTINGLPYKAMRLTFDPGTGDSSDDWYRIYVDADTRRIGAMAYVVTYGRKLTDSSPLQTHAVVYDDFTRVNGVTLPLTWYFRDWTEERGFSPQINGTAQLTNPRFVTPPPDFFARPANAVEDPLPPR